MGHPELAAAAPQPQARNSAWGDGGCWGWCCHSCYERRDRGSAETWCCPSRRPKKKLPDDLSLGTSTQTTLTSHFTCREVLGGWKKKEEVCIVKSYSRA